MSADEIIRTASNGTTRLKHVAGVIDCKHVTPTYVEDGYPCISTGEVKPFSIAFSSKRLVSTDDFETMRLGGRDPRPDDIIYSRNASVGSAARVGGTAPFCVGQDLCIIRPKAIRSDLLELLLNSHFVLSQLEEVLVGSTLQRVNIDTIRRFSIPVVERSSQALLADRLRDAHARSSHLSAKVSASIDRLKEYRAALITAAVTGQIDVHTWSRRGQGDRRLDRIEEKMAG